MLDSAKYTALQIAKYFIKKSKPTDRLTNLKLQKILYYAQGWYLANFKKPLFGDKIEAWKYGPAIRTIYQQFKNNGNAVLNDEVGEWEIKEIDKQTQKFLDEVWNVYKKYSGSDLVSLTHKEPPYIEARNSIKEGDNSEIEIGRLSMLNFFQEKLNGK